MIYKILELQQNNKIVLIEKNKMVAILNLKEYINKIIITKY